MPAFSINEIIEMAVQIERNGYAFYNEAAKRKDLDDDSRKLITWLRDAELDHEKTFLRLRDEVDNMVDIGTRLGMNFVIAGTITKRGSTISTSYKIASVAGRGVIHKGQFTSSGEADLIHHVEKMSEDVIAVIRRSAR